MSAASSPSASSSSSAAAAAATTSGGSTKPTVSFNKRLPSTPAFLVPVKGQSFEEHLKEAFREAWGPIGYDPGDFSGEDREMGNLVPKAAAEKVAKAVEKFTENKNEDPNKIAEDFANFVKLGLQNVTSASAQGQMMASLLVQSVTMGGSSGADSRPSVSSQKATIKTFFEWLFTKNPNKSLLAAQKDLDDARKKLEQAEKCCRDAQTAIQAEKEKATKLGDEKGDLENRLRAVTDENRRLLEDGKGKLAGAISEVRSCEEQVRAAQIERDNIIRKSNELVEEIEKKNGDLKDLEGKVQAAIEKCRAMDSEKGDTITRLMASQADLSKKLDEAKKQKEASDDRARALQEELELLKPQIEELKRREKELAARIQELDPELSKARKTIEALHTFQDKCDEEKKKLGAERDSLLGENDRLSKKNQQLESQLRDCGKKNQDESSRVPDLEKKIQELDNLVPELRAEIENLQAEINKAPTMDEVESLKAQLAKAPREEDIEDLKGVVANLKGENNRLAEENNNLRRSLRECTSRPDPSPAPVLDTNPNNNNDKPLVQPTKQEGTPDKQPVLTPTPSKATPPKEVAEPLPRLIPLSKETVLYTTKRPRLAVPIKIEIPKKGSAPAWRLVKVFVAVGLSPKGTKSQDPRKKLAETTSRMGIPPIQLLSSIPPSSVPAVSKARSTYQIDLDEPVGLPLQSKEKVTENDAMMGLEEASEKGRLPLYIESSPYTALPNSTLSEIDGAPLISLPSSSDNTPRLTRDSSERVLVIVTGVWIHNSDPKVAHVSLDWGKIKVEETQKVNPKESSAPCPPCSTPAKSEAPKTPLPSTPEPTVEKKKVPSPSTKKASPKMDRPTEEKTSNGGESEEEEEEEEEEKKEKEAKKETKAPTPSVPNKAPATEINNTKKETFKGPFDLVLERVDRVLTEGDRDRNDRSHFNAKNNAYEMGFAARSTNGSKANLRSVRLQVTRSIDRETLSKIGSEIEPVAEPVRSQIMLAMVSEAEPIEIENGTNVVIRLKPSLSKGGAEVSVNSIRNTKGRVIVDMRAPKELIFPLGPQDKAKNKRMDYEAYTWNATPIFALWDGTKEYSVSPSVYSQLKVDRSVLLSLLSREKESQKEGRGPVIEYARSYSVLENHNHNHSAPSPQTSKTEAPSPVLNRPEEPKTTEPGADQAKTNSRVGWGGIGQKFSSLIGYHNTPAQGDATDL